MENLGWKISRHGIEQLEGAGVSKAFWNLSSAELYEQSMQRGEASVTQHGVLTARTGSHTGRSPNDRFVVRESSSEADIAWGSVNREISSDHFEGLLSKIQAYLKGRELFVFDGHAGADPAQQLKVRVVTEFAWHNLFARNMFLDDLEAESLQNFAPEFTVIDAPGCLADPSVDGTSSSTFVVVDFGRRLVLIGGTAYAGEIKKSIFSVMNYRLPKAGVFSMHCSCNYGENRDDVALFFGLSGTGKTTLSADPGRTLIGDDEHGWGDGGVFNIEGGCYAKAIRLSREGEPEIWDASHRFGSILENVEVDPETRVVDFDGDKYTENTRSSYPLTSLEQVDLGGQAGHPKTVIFLTCDAFGVLPPIARLTSEQAMYHFLSGYTAKVAGTERGITEPTATFSACFGAPFLPLHPSVYARMLGEKLEEYGATVWLVNTGWSGGAYGTGQRISLKYTRKMVTAALAGILESIPTRVDSVFGVAVPTKIDGVPAELLDPRSTWSNGGAFDDQARQLAEMFRTNFGLYADQVSAEIRAAGPRV